MTYEQVFHMINDEIGLSSEDSFFNLEHIEFLCSKWRAYLIQTDNLNSKIIKSLGFESPLFQQLCIDLVRDNFGYSCDGGDVLKSTDKIPERINGTLKIDLNNFLKGANVVYIDPQRFKYQGCNKWMKNIIYASILPDGYLYLKSSNTNFLNLEKVKITAIFQNIEDVKDKLCDKNGDRPCDYMKSEYPLSEYQLPALIQYVVNELLGASYRPKDILNNSNDDLSQLGLTANDNNKEKNE